MAMLAEQRRKKSWVLNPRGSQWAEDDSKFGQKMLEQMGWSKGKGLGKEMKGITEHIRPSVQNDSRGLGFEGKSDEWVAHLDDFNDLLASLQQDQKSQDRDDSKVQTKSLEERSRKSKARVHYHKFTRGKDLSRYSSQDLACILGGRSGEAASQPVTPVSSRPPSPPPHAGSEPVSDAEPDAPVTEVDSSSGYTTIVTGKSVKDYFAEKMRKMKIMRLKRQREYGDEMQSENKEDGAVLENAIADCVDEELNEGESLERKLKKKKKRHTSADVNTSSGDGNGEEAPAEKRKKKKRKNEDAQVGEHGEQVVAESVCIETRFETDGDKSSKRRKISNAVTSEDAVPTASAGEASERKKRRKKNKTKKGEE
ncbi:PIN2/TERF1-interacting telomerase inhibitor 1-like [Pollicipes pollicipes]|uniref:PIN2/TERF1-interacting telomerase inhibitor 1-like n=1 Tax=Pollicipes pollicipes TaxID=41117 RepID=UPI0018851CAD|nr:PIN2/TERF1-interacting telomerase inhibitor 1-like [Pollicipes pollicipes]XP_037093370.1 PIN2/TERF1-interacting telomerase inhibitor 1-like [Pollicipes pollicipes]XP_037093371.1 PIN2/TERF1-interacting telomerase inhibitor 1-like [Pollicipes pollicipes]XP_037093372.1 PIN2/TERF1-interacting telomerase inhibitor 1-like [Pollicipes pollicipes]XP_037093373.1 PIN2/TERF1-interacting telomerase inhibitor 1-like [Pollicipes pollicipes]